MGILPTQYAVNVLEYIMKMAVENVSDVSFSNQSSFNLAHTKKSANLLGSDKPQKDGYTEWICGAVIPRDISPNQS